MYQQYDTPAIRCEAISRKQSIGLPGRQLTERDPDCPVVVFPGVFEGA